MNCLCARALHVAVVAALPHVSSAAGGAQEAPPAGTIAIPASPIAWSVRVPTQTSRTATLAARIPDGWYLYSLTQPAGGPTRTVIEVLPPWRATGPVQAPDPAPYPDRNFNIMSEVYTDSVAFTVPVARDRFGAASTPVRVAVTFQTCTSRYCLPPRTDTLQALVSTVASAAATGANARAAVTTTSAIARDTRASATTTEATTTASNASVPPASRTPNTGLLALLVTAASTALLALLTPCVFPMIPITVGFFSSRADRSAASVGRALIIFALGIVVAFVTLGVGVSFVLGATGVFQLAANPWLNLIIAALFAGFALQLAGVMHVRAPSSMLTKLSRATQSGEGSATLLLMGSTFALTSFTCTAPFVGSLLVLASTGGVMEPSVGLLAFALVFASPFLVLAVAPQLASRLPRSGPWLDTIKGAAAFAELAVVAKFVSNAGMVWGWTWMTRELVIGTWLVIVAALLLWLWRANAKLPSVTRAPRLVGAAVVVFVAAWLAIGLTGRPLGELEAYLPPPRGADGVHAPGDLPWTLNDWPRTVAQASATGRSIFVDFTGYTCTNCRWMEANMFPRPAIRAAMAAFERARLYTDGRGEPYQTQQQLQVRRFGSVALPLYVIVRADGVTTVAQFLGMTRDEREFLAFLASGVAVSR